MSELSENLRRGIIDLLTTIANADQQLAYQKRVPHVNVVVELICTWADDLYHPQSSAFAATFSARELAVLAEFNLEHDDIANSLPEPVPELDTFVQSDAGRRSRDAARRALDGLVHAVNG